MPCFVCAFDSSSATTSLVCGTEFTRSLGRRKVTLTQTLDFAMIPFNGVPATLDLLRLSFKFF